jgi:hypothetical protein
MMVYVKIKLDGGFVHYQSVHVKLWIIVQAFKKGVDKQRLSLKGGHSTRRISCESKYQFCTECGAGGKVY